MKHGGAYLTARQAADALAVTRATLYAYISRGQLRSEPVPGRTRERQYVREDVERLLERKEARRDPQKAAARGLYWGGPLLESGITLIHNGRCYYRGRDAVVFAERATFEEAALLLWGAEPAEATGLFDRAAVRPSRRLAALRSGIDDPLTLLQCALAVVAKTDLASYDLRPASVRQAGARICRLMAAVLSPRGAALPMHRALQSAWSPRREAPADVMRTALVLCADHELNVSAFTARCAASAGASPYDVVSAAMATLKGFRHGGAAERVMGLLADAGTLKSARALVASRLRRGESVPGFGHPLYPNGDPRARLLLRLAESSGNARAWQPIRNLWKAGSELLHDEPTLDFGLAAIAHTYALPEQAPVLLFAVGRTVGWIAHAIEEYASGKVIRPRARYTGPMPA
jgi:citrate synthase